MVSLNLIFLFCSIRYSAFISAIDNALLNRLSKLIRLNQKSAFKTEQNLGDNSK